MKHLVLNFVGFQACWFAGVLGAAWGMPSAGPVVLVVWLAVHFTSMRAAAPIDARLLAAAALLGWATDSALVLGDLIVFPAHAWSGAPSPLWMLAIWIGFAATLRHSLGWLRGRFLLGATLGAIGGPIAYRSGEALDAVSVNGLDAYIAIAVQFAAVTSALLTTVHHLERGTGAPARANS